MYRRILALLFMVSTHALAQQEDVALDIKGIRLGMSKDQVASIVREANANGGGFGIGGVRPREKSRRGLTVYDDYAEGKLDAFSVLFEASAFEAVEMAVRTKYPSVTCLDSPSRTFSGVELTQRTCVVHGRGERIVLSRYLSDVREGFLQLVSQRYYDERKARREIEKHDL